MVRERLSTSALSRWASASCFLTTKALVSSSTLFFTTMGRYCFILSFSALSVSFSFSIAAYLPLPKKLANYASPEIHQTIQQMSVDSLLQVLLPSCISRDDGICLLFLQAIHCLRLHDILFQSYGSTLALYGLSPSSLLRLPRRHGLYIPVVPHSSGWDK